MWHISHGSTDGIIDKEKTLCKEERMIGWLYCGLTPLTAMVISWWSVTHMCFQAFSQQY